jgi:Cu-Zn family superoxide dismutase
MCTSAIAVFNDKKVRGFIIFHQKHSEKGASVYYNLFHIPKNKTMACHIHEFGDMTDGCVSLGGHWNPTQTTHGSIEIDITKSHAGDLTNNIHANSKGEFIFSYFDPRLNIIGNINNSIIGRSVVIHKGVDDLGQGRNAESLKTGNAGSRISCAVIGIKNT